MAKQYLKECRETRIDIEKRVNNAIILRNFVHLRANGFIDSVENRVIV